MESFGVTHLCFYLTHQLLGITHLESKFLLQRKEVVGMQAGTENCSRVNF